MWSLRGLRNRVLPRVNQSTYAWKKKTYECRICFTTRNTNLGLRNLLSISLNRITRVYMRLYEGILRRVLRDKKNEQSRVIVNSDYRNLIMAWLITRSIKRDLRVCVVQSLHCSLSVRLFLDSVFVSKGPKRCRSNYACSIRLDLECGIEIRINLFIKQKYIYLHTESMYKFFVN